MQKLFNGIFLVPFFILGLSLSAQVNSVSPYSKLGLGELQPSNYARSLSMGGANLALRDNFFINNTNAASYSNLELTTFEAGFHLNLIRQEQATNDISIENSTAGLQYFSFGVPLTDWWGSAIGIQPYSSRGYNISTKRSNTPDNIAVTDSFLGSGGINKVYWGNGFEVAEGLSLGVNAAFLFGTLSEQNFILWNEGINDVLVEEEVFARGFRFDYGLQYSYEFKGGSELSTGITFTNESELAAEVDRYSILIGDNGAPYDSLIGSGTGSGNIVLPNELGFGLTFGKRQNSSINYSWAVSGDFHYYGGDNFTDFDGTRELVNSWKAQLGGYVVPALVSQNLQRSGNYLGQMEYRVGGFYEQTPYSVSGEQLSDYGITFGLGIPVRQRSLGPGEMKRSFINAGVVLGRRGTLENGLIRESYANIYVGITLNDKWFIQYKYR